MLFAQAFAWIFTGANWVTGPVAGQRLVETLVTTGWSVLFAVLIAFPLGVLIGHTGRGRAAAILISNIARALPALDALQPDGRRVGVDEAAREVLAPADVADGPGERVRVLQRTVGALAVHDAEERGEQ